MPEVLRLFKQIIGISGTGKDGLFNSIINSAVAELAAQGIEIDEYDGADQMLVADIAAFQHINAGEDKALPEYIRSRINRRKTKGRCSDA